MKAITLGFLAIPQGKDGTLTFKLKDLFDPLRLLSVRCCAV
jgi:hypothetical protein